MIRVLIADDHALVRAGLVELLKKMSDVEVVGQAGDGHEALRLTHSLSPDIVLLDIAMPGVNGIEIAAQLTKESSKSHVILLSMFGTEAHLKKALQAKVSGYLLKGADLEELNRALHAVDRGEVYIMPAVATHLARAMTPASTTSADELDRLTARQREVLKLVVEGLSSKEMAFRLGLSTKTIDAHRAQVMEKLGIHDIPGLVHFAIRTGMIQQDGSASPY